MGYKPKSLGHVNICVRNVEQSRRWYEDLLGLHTYDFTPGRSAFMSADLEQSHEVALMEIGKEAAGPQKGQVGLDHMAWRMDSLEDLKELFRRLKEKNVPIDEVGDHGIALGLYFHDPDGNGIEAYYELPRKQWHRQDKLFDRESRPRGQFPGPWDELLSKKVAK